MMQRTITHINRSVTYPPVDTSQSPRDWLLKLARLHNLRWLLAHDSGGVIWGEVCAHTLHLSCDTLAFPQDSLALRWETMQQCRLFSEAGELLVWQGPRIGQSPPDSTEVWQARLILDTLGDSDTIIDEAYLLWGTGSDETKGGFMRLIEGSQGIVHTPPLNQIPTETKRAKVQVRHYLTEDGDTGMLRIGLSRLVRLVEPDLEEGEGT